MISTAAVTMRASPIGQTSEQPVFLGQDVAALAHAIVDDLPVTFFALIVIGADDRRARILIRIDLIRARGGDVIVDASVSPDFGIGLLPAGIQIRRRLILGARRARVIVR